MNYIYKLIWSKTKNCWVVASELAKGHGKNKSRIKNSLLAVFVMSALLAGGTADVQALTQQEKDEVKNEVAKYLLDKIAHGGEIPGAKAEYGPTSFPEAIANRIFYYDDVSNKIGEKLKHDGLALQYFGVRPNYIEPKRDYLNRYADPDWTNVDNDGAFGAHSMALGYRAFSEAKHGVAIGREALAGGYHRDNSYGGDGDVAIGNSAWALGDKAVSIGDKAISADKSIAIGIQAEAGANKKDSNSILLDPTTKLPYVVSDIAKMNSAIAIGRDAKAWGHQSVSIGGGAKATGKYALSFGNSAEASAMDSFAFGNYASAKGLGAIAIGSDYESSSGGAQAYSGDTIAIGRRAMAGNENDTATEYNTVAIGREARAYGKNSIALGGTANVGDVWQKQLAEGGTAIGSSANAALENATAIGYKSIAYAKDAVTLGANTRADIDGGVALGSESNVGSYSSSSYGKAGKVGYDPLGAGADETSTWKATKAAVSVGNQQKDITRQIINVAAGTDNTDAVNVAQLKALQSKAWKDLVASENKLGARIATNTTSITNLSGRVRTNEGDIGRLKTDVSTNDSRIRYLYNNMPFMHYVSVKSEGMAPNEGNYKNDGASKQGAIAIGAHTSSDGDGAVALGAYSFVRGQGSVIVGENSDNYTGGLKAKEGQFDQSIILGSDNTIFAQSAENGGREDKVIGNMNRVEESHGTFVRGTGNFVYDAYNPEALTDEDKQKEQDFLDPIDGGDPTGLFQKGRSHVSVEGDGNMVMGALYTQVSGVGNEISNTDHDDGTSTPKVTYNIVTGNRNTVADSSHNIIMGDNHELENVNGNIIIGSLKTKAKTTASNVTVLGNDADVSVEGGVALGTGSQAATAAGVFGYDPATDKASTTDNATWKSGNGAVSVGAADKTRQITNLAAGLADTDAVNVAQLKALNTKVDNLPSIHYFSVKADDSKKPADTNWNNDGATGNKAIAIGQKAKSEGYAAVAMGASAHTGANAHYSLALGVKSDAAGFANIALGNEAKAQAAMYATAIGQEAAVTKNQGIAIGTTAKTDAENGISFGTQAKSLANRGIAVGTNSTVDQTGGRGIAIGDGAYVGAKTQDHSGEGMPNPGDAWNPSEPYLPVADDTVAGPGKLARENSMAIGMKASAFGFQTTALGAGAEAHDTNTTAVGAAAVAKGNYSTALGKQARTFEKESTSVGHWADSRAEFATALGSNTIVYKKGGVALGFGARAYDENSIAIGSNSFAKEAIDGKAYLSEEEVKAAAGIVSVGNPAYKAGDKDVAANYRRIVNVAGGINDNDAVNVAQLKALEGKVTTNTGDITTNKNDITGLKKGFIVKDGGTGKANVTLGGDKEPEVTFKAAVDTTTDATAGGSSLTSSVDKDRNVTYSLNMKQLKQDLGITDGPDGVMSSWKLKAKDETTPQEIKNGNTVTFDASGNGLTVERKDSTIKYTIDGSKLDIAKNQSIINLGDRIDNLPSIHYFSVKSDDSKNPADTNWNNDGATGKNAIAIGKDAKAERESSVVIGLKASSGVAANDGVAVGSSASVTGFGGVAIGRESSAEGQETVAIGTGAKGVIHRTVAIGGYANADGFGAVAIGRDSMSKERGVSVGIQSNSKEFAVSVGTNSFSNFRSVAVGELANAEAPYAVAVGDQTGSYAMGAVTLGNKTRAFGDGSVAIGNQARVSGKGITPEEYKALPEADQKLYRLYEAVYYNYDDPSKPIVDRKYYKVIDAHDWRAENHYNSIAIGTTSFVEAKEAIGIGAGTRINGDLGVALGYAAVSEEKGTALGAGAQAKANAGVALGEGAVADTAAEVAGYDPLTGEASTETTSTWKSVKGAVSVGTADKTRQITNLAAGLADTDAVNVAQLKNAKTTVEAGDYVTVTKKTEDGKGTTYTVKGPNLTSVDKNLTVTDDKDANDKKVGYKLELSKTLTGLTSVSSEAFKVGDKTYINSNGINANNNKITNVAPGTKDGDAVNFKQLKDVDSKVTTNTGDITTLKKGWTLEDGNATKGTKIVKAEDTVKVTSDDYITATVNNDGLKLGMNVTKLNTQINDQIDNSDTVKEKMKSWVLKAATTDKDPAAKGQTIDNTNNVATFDVEENQGLTVARDGATIKYGVNNNQLVGNINSGNTAVTNISAKFSVTDGTNTKAVNLGKDKNNNVKFLGTDGETTVTVGGNDDAPTVTVGLDAKFKKQVTDNTSNIAENKTNITNLTTRVDGHDTAIENNTKAIGENAKAIGENTKAIGENTKAIEKNAGDITTLTGRVDTAEKTIGENTKAIGENTKAIGENTKAIEKNAGDITTLTGRVDTAEKTIGENTKAIGENTKAIGENAKAIGENTKAIGENAKAIGENAKAIGENAKAIGENTKAIGENTKTIGKNTEKIEQNAKDIAAKMTSWTVKAGEEAAGQKIDNTNNAVTFDVAAKDQGLTVTRDGSTIKYGIEGSKIDISENKTVNELKDEIAKKKTVVKAGDENISVTKADDKEEYTVTLAKNLKGLNSVSATTVNAGTVKADTVDTKTVKVSDKITVGERDTVTINNEGLTIKDGPSVKKDGINAGGKIIANVADGKEDSDAVNVKQLKAIENQSNQNISILGGRVSELNTRVNRVGAGAAALAALHPLDFDPDDKWDFAAGYGNYSGANAVAIGAYYRPNEDTMFSVGGSFGGGENMVNAGVSVKLGQGNHVTTSRVAMAKEIKDLRAEVEVLRQAVTGIGQGQTPDPVKMKLFPDIAKNHWAYEAVEELTKQGLLEGYPDGTFGGDRMMTRYEFAEIVYRAMQKGLNVNEKLIQEFEPELERFRIDVISKDKNGNPVIERVRVNEKRKAK